MSRVFFSIKDGVNEVLLSKKRNFVESVDVAVRFSCDDVVKGEVDFLHPFVDVKKLLVFADGDDVSSVRNLGIDLVGGVDLINSIKDNKSLLKRVSYCVASSGLISEVQKIAKILAVRGIMPNVNNGTLTKDVFQVIDVIRNGKSWFKSSKAKIIQVKIGNVAFPAEKIIDNFNCLVGAIFRSSTKVKKALSSVSLSTTMGPSVFCDISSVNEGALQ